MKCTEQLSPSCPYYAALEGIITPGAKGIAMWVSATDHC